MPLAACCGADTRQLFRKECSGRRTLPNVLAAGAEVTSARQAACQTYNDDAVCAGKAAVVFWAG